MRYSKEEKLSLVNFYYNGKSVTEICMEHQIPRSTFYTWIQAYRPVESKNSSRTVTPKDFDSLLRRYEKQEQIIAVLKSIPAIANVTTQEKLAVLEPFYGQFSVHVLCEALDVPRGTFYNHIKRNKRDNSSYAKHREELRTAIQEIFEESRQTFGSEKICAVLHERGYRAGTTLINLSTYFLWSEGWQVEYGTIRIKLDELLKASGLSKNMLSHRAEMQRTQINNYCKNQITRLDIDVLARLCTVLNCEIGDLLEFIPPEKIEK